MHPEFSGPCERGLSAQKFDRRTELSCATKLSSGDETPLIANVLLVAELLFLTIHDVV